MLRPTGETRTKNQNRRGARKNLSLLLSFFLAFLGYSAFLLVFVPLLEQWLSRSVLVVGIAFLTVVAVVIAGHVGSERPSPRIIKQAEDVIEQSGHLYRLLADNVSDMVFTVDFAERITYASPSTQRVCGFAPDALSGQPVERLLTPASARAFEALLGKESATAGGADVAHALPSHIVEMVMRRPDGKLVPTETSLALLRDPNNLPVGMIASARDITERKNAERKSAEAHELRARFIQIVAHQLRTPLNSMRWNLEAMIAGEIGTLTKTQQEFLQLTHTADIEVIRRIHDLLAAMDIEEGNVRITRGRARLEDIWNALWRETRRRCGEKGVRCSMVSRRQPLPTISGDEGKILDMLRTLMENAIVYTARGGAVRVRWEQVDSHVRFTVTDTGIGIPAQDQKRMFTRFFRAGNAASMKPDASGVALSNAKYYVEQHGGKMRFTSREGQGSAFWVELPTH